MKQKEIAFNGRTMSIEQWAKDTGIKQHTIVCRLSRGWSIERALTEQTQSRIELIGHKVGKWNVLKEVGRKHNSRYYLCKCECGNECEVRATCLNNGESLQCSKCCAINNGKKTLIHGLTKSKIGRTYNGMISRCYNTNNKEYHNYGGRGILVCDEWRNNILQFAKDMGDPPSPKHSIGRIDNNGPYAPWNCRWETAIQQANNTRKVFNPRKLAAIEIRYTLHPKQYNEGVS